MERDAGNQILLVGTGREIESSVLAKERYSYRSITMASWHGRTFTGRMQSLLCLPRGFRQAWHLIRSFGPDLVLGMGGYASGPVVLSAWVLGKKTAVHEQNAYPGLSNRILGRFVDRVFVSFVDSSRHFPPGKTVLTGNPVRKRMRPKKKEFSGQRRPAFTLFIFGGSQGAHKLNLAMMEALPFLRDQKGKWRIIHQTGSRDFSEVQEGYAKEGWEAEVHPFIHEIDQAYDAADLVLCRAGATTLFELMAMGKPAILVPYPFAANDHQTLNAQVLVRAGAALLVGNGELTGSLLGRRLMELSGDRTRLRSMGEASASLARLDAAQKVVDCCYEMISHA